MRLLILDIDGVLNSTRSAIGFGGFGHMPTAILQMPPDEVRRVANLDPVAYGILNRILTETRCKVLISSVWRMGATIEELNYLFLCHQLPPVVIGRTDIHPSGFRGREVRQWLAKHKRLGIKDYLILDDDSDFFSYQKGRFLKVDGAVGLGYEQYRFIDKRWNKKRKPSKNKEPAHEIASPAPQSYTPGQLFRPRRHW
jgi:hypothetical protein